MKKFIFALFFYSVTLICSAQQPYYNDVDLSLNGTSLKNELATKVINTHTTFLTYSQAYQIVKRTDEDSNNTSNVILFYNGQSEPKTNTVGGGNTSNPEVWNREHVYPKSLGIPNLGTSGPGSDAHHLRACDKNINSNRSNLKFTAGSGGFGITNGNWYPGDEWKGDVARMMMYMYLRYGNQCKPKNVGTGSTVANDPNMIDLFLQWNAEDPVSGIEEQRNTILETEQGNRNPFIDNPYLATKIWGGTPAQDIWGTLAVEEAVQSNFRIYPNPITKHIVFIQSNTETIKRISLYSLTGQNILVENHPKKRNNKIYLDNLPSGFYILKINSEIGVTTKKIIIN